MNFKNIKNKEAVSPVIGVILMVAITVLLAAVVYLWVIGFIGGGAKGTPTTSYTLGTAPNGDYRVVLSSVSEKKSVKGYTYTVVDSSGVAVPGMTGTVDQIYCKELNGILFYDNDGDGQLTTSDFFDIDPSGVTAGCHLKLTYVSGQIALDAALF